MTESADVGTEAVPRDADETRVLSVLLTAAPALLSRAEVAAEIGNRIVAEDGINGLVRVGLAHTLDGFVWASRAAIAADEFRL